LHWKIIENTKNAGGATPPAELENPSSSDMAMPMGNARTLQITKKTQDIPEENQET
jgi:hypothetical protein